MGISQFFKSILDGGKVDVAARYGIHVVLVANMRLGTPRGLSVEMVVVDRAPDAADDWIAEHVEKDDIVVTGDIPLTARCLDKQARVLGHKGRPFTDENVGDARFLRVADFPETRISGMGAAPVPPSPPSTVMKSGAASAGIGTHGGRSWSST